MRWAAAILAVAACGWASGAAAQTGAQGKGEPTSTLMETMCMPWLAGADAQKFVADAEARGFRRPVVSSGLKLLYTPKALFDRGWQSVTLGEMGLMCTIAIVVPGDDLAYLTADVQNSLVRNYPAGTWKTKPQDWRDGVFGKATRVRAWNSATQEVVLTETPDADMTAQYGAPVVVVTVVMMRVG